MRNHHIKAESRVFCRCELCRLRFGRLLYPKVGGEPLGLGRLPGFSGNFSTEWVKIRQQKRSKRQMTPVTELKDRGQEIAPGN